MKFSTCLFGYRGKQLGVYLPDTDERAMGYLAGPSPNRWGILSDGSHVSDLLRAASGKKEERRSHPLFGHVVLLVMQEVSLCIDITLKRRSKDMRIFEVSV